MQKFGNNGKRRCRFSRGFPGANDGAGFRTLELAFDTSTDEIIEILLRNGVTQQDRGESRAAFVQRIRQDVAHDSARVISTLPSHAEARPGSRGR